MDDKETQRETLKAIYRFLPEQIKNTIFAPETSEAYDKVTERYQLNTAQREAISTQSGLLMMGLRLPQEFVTVLTKELNIPREKASLIAQELNRDIFNAIREDLKKIHEIEKIKVPEPVPLTPVVPSKPADPLYPSFLQQIKDSTPPYISGSFPSAAPMPAAIAKPTLTVPTAPQKSIPVATSPTVAAQNISLPQNIPSKTVPESASFAQQLPPAPMPTLSSSPTPAVSAVPPPLPQKASTLPQPAVSVPPTSNAVLQPVAQPKAPLSVFEQKMSGVFAIKSDAQNYSQPSAPLSTPQIQTPVVSQIPPPTTIAPPGTGDTYGETVS